MKTRVYNQKSPLYRLASFYGPLRIGEDTDICYFTKACLIALIPITFGVFFASIFLSPFPVLLAWLIAGLPITEFFNVGKGEPFLSFFPHIVLISEIMVTACAGVIWGSIKVTNYFSEKATAMVPNLVKDMAQAAHEKVCFPIHFE